MLCHHRSSRPEAKCEMMVAQATPATSQWKTITKSRSRTMFIMAAMMRAYMGLFASPRPRMRPFMPL